MQKKTIGLLFSIFVFRTGAVILTIMTGTSYEANGYIRANFAFGVTWTTLMLITAIAAILILHRSLRVDYFVVNIPLAVLALMLGFDFANDFMVLFFPAYNFLHIPNLYFG